MHTTAPNTAAAGAEVNNTNQKVIFKNCAAFTEWITEINNTQVDDVQKIYVVISMYNLRKHIRGHQEVYSNNIEINRL